MLGETVDVSTAVAVGASAGRADDTEVVVVVTVGVEDWVKLVS
jgi:hypothetical protein